MSYIPASDSVVAFQGNPSVLQVTANFPANQSVSGAVSISNLPTSQNVNGSVVAFQGAGWSGSVAAAITNNPTFLQLAGSVLATSATVNTGNSSVQVLNFPANQSVSGTVVANQGTSPWIITGSVQGSFATGNSSVQVLNFPTTQNVSGSVVAFGFPANQSVSGAISVSNFPTTQNVSGSVAAFLNGTQSPSMYGMRNDAVASFLGADLTVRPIATDSAGRTVIKPFVPEDGIIINYVGSIVSDSVTLIQASAIGKRSYITDFWIANTGSVATLITFQDGSTSILGHTIAPAGGGSNSPGIAIPIKTAPSQDLAFKMSVTPSVLYMTVKGYQAP